MFPNGYQDLITPFICSDRWPDDTLFFVLEEDMEFYEHGIIPGRCDTAVASSGSSSFTVPRGMGSIFCSDMVRLATKADRSGKGNFIRFGYQPWGHEPRKKAVTWPRLGYGPQGIMLTKAAARSIKVFLSSGFKRAGHIDMLLKEWWARVHIFWWATHSLAIARTHRFVG